VLDVLAIALPPIAAFVIGTCTPAIARRFSFEGFEVRQLRDYIVISETEAGGLIFSTALKIVNGTTKTLILTEMDCPGVPGLELQRLELQRIEGTITLPPTALDYLPLAVQPDRELVLGLGLWFRNEPGARQAAPISLQGRLAAGYRVRMQVNGKSRYLRLSLRLSNL